jgi:predicted GNAT family acetyltransferase
MRAFDAETGAIPSQPPAEAWVRPAIERGDAFVWEDERGQPAATASVGGRTRLCGRIHLVYVPPELRRRQFASACVRALALRLRAEGLRDATLFVDPKAERAVALYRGLGFARVADFVELPLLFRL